MWDIIAHDGHHVLCISRPRSRKYKKPTGLKKKLHHFSPAYWKRAGQLWSTDASTHISPKGTNIKMHLLDLSLFLHDHAVKRTDRSRIRIPYHHIIQQHNSHTGTTTHPHTKEEDWAKAGDYEQTEKKTHHETACCLFDRLFVLSLSLSLPPPPPLPPLTLTLPLLLSLSFFLFLSLSLSQLLNRQKEKRKEKIPSLFWSNGEKHQPWSILFLCHMYGLISCAQKPTGVSYILGDRVGSTTDGDVRAQPWDTTIIIRGTGRSHKTDHYRHVQYTTVRWRGRWL